MAMRAKRLDSKSGCAVEITLSVIGGLWKPVILFHLLKEKKRFMELTRLMPKTTQRMLTLQLRELEADGIVARHVYPQIPPKVEYELTSFGATLAPALLSLKEWGKLYQRRLGVVPGALSRDEVKPAVASPKRRVAEAKKAS
jgi:DNA-binding HxlR family transcriptional regulator